MANKIKIDLDLLTRFYLCDDSEITSEMIREVDKVINIVVIKHFSSNANNSDLRQSALLHVLERRNAYDPSFSAYNYTYTQVRNEIGNKIKKYGREVFTDDEFPFNSSYSIDPAELPEEIRKYAEHLVGLPNYNVLRIPQTDVIPLIAFLRLYDSKPKYRKMPDFLTDNPRSAELLYKLLNDFIVNG